MSGTKQLFILRHAKSSWEDPGLNDHDRPLAPRGQRAVKVLAKHIRRHDIHPAQVLCSTSRRTRETLEGVGLGGEHLIEPALYSAGAQDLLDRLHQVPDHVPSVMLIGHNPAVQILVLRLANNEGGTGDGSPLSQVQRKFPTAALATLTFDCDWSELAPGRAQLVDFVRPKALGPS